jgi:hypothetical protein
MCIKANGGASVSVKCGNITIQFSTDGKFKVEVSGKTLPAGATFGSE